MSYYKISDRVKITQIPPDSKDIEVGDEGTIVNMISAHLYRIKLDKGPSLDLNAQQFEKVR
jgi:hypothetical protein